MEKTFNEIREDLTKKINDIRDPKTGYNFSVNPDDPTDVLGIFINNIALQILEKTELLIRLRNSLNPFKAVGRELRDVITYRGLTAKEGTRTKTVVKFSGEKGLLIPSGTELSNDSGEKVFITSKDVSTNESNYADVIAYCSKVGNIVLEEGELTKLINPIYGIRITNNSDITMGVNDESDNEIHLRLSDNTGATGVGFLDTLDSALMNLNGVKSAVTYVGKDENKKLETGEICCVVHGGNDGEIAKTIFEKNMFLYKYIGNTQVAVKSNYLNRSYLIKFERPETINLKCEIQVADLHFGYPPNLDHTLYENTKKFIESFSSNSIIFSSDLIAFLKNLMICKIIDCVIYEGELTEEQSGKLVGIDWNKAPTLNREDFSVEKN